MPRPSGACHVAEITRTHGGRRYRYYLLRRTYREGGKVKHETLANLSRLPAATIALIRRAVRGEVLVAPDDAFEIIRARAHGHVAAVVGTLRKVGLPAWLAAARERDRDLVEALIAARLLDPCSKLATARALATDTPESSLGESLGVADADEDALDGAMDWLLARQARVEQALARRHLTDGDLVLYDVTSTHFEGRKCPWAQFGHSRDGRRDKWQIVVGLLTNGEGCPVAVEVFAGNPGDPKTLPAQIKKIRERFAIARVGLVGDRGLLTDARLREDRRPIEGLDWITALRAPAIHALAAGGALPLTLFDQRIGRRSRIPTIRRSALSSARTRGWPRSAPARAGRCSRRPHASSPRSPPLRNGPRGHSGAEPLLPCGLARSWGGARSANTSRWRSPIPASGPGATRRRSPKRRPSMGSISSGRTGRSPAD